MACGWRETDANFDPHDYWNPLDYPLRNPNSMKQGPYIPLNRGAVATLVAFLLILAASYRNAALEPGFF